METSTTLMAKSLLELIDKKEKVIIKQNETIAKLLNQNAEQENLINVMMQEHTD